jgi:WD40 repeat protein
VAVEKFLVIVPFQEQQLIRLWDRHKLTLMHGYKGH